MLDSIDLNSIEIEIDSGDTGDYGDNLQGWISYAKFKDGNELTEDELDELNNGKSCYDVGELIYERWFRGEL